jgi:serine/threonine protein kinase
MSGIIPVAIKTAYRSVPVESLLKEIHLLSTVKSAYCVRLLGIYQVNDLDLNIVTEYIEGGDLSTLLYQTQENISEEMRLLIIRDIALGLQYLHELQIIHRDLKPENCLIRTLSPSANQHAVIADFGLSKICANLGGADTAIMTTNIGTSVYMAPGTFFY